MRTQISSAALVVLMAASAFGQRPGSRLGSAASFDSQSNSLVHGQVYLEDATAGSLTLELAYSNGIVSTDIPVQPDGSFDCAGLASGQYTLTLIGFEGRVLHQEPVIIRDGYQNLSVFVRKSGSNTGSAPGTVSVRQLQHKVPEQARGEFDKGRTAIKKGDGVKALDHFRRAETIDPDFAEAYNSSGTVYVKLGQLEDAAGEFQKAVTLVPDYPDALANLSIVLCRLQRYQQAEDTARRALKLNSGLLKVRYVLGLSLTMVGGDRVEALENVQLAAAEIAQAHLLAGKILEANGQREEAANQVDTYLRSAAADSPDRKDIEDWLQELRRQ